MSYSNLRASTLSLAASLKNGETRITLLLEYMNGIFQGQTIIDQSGEVLKHGLGAFAFDNGDYYFGEWEHDEMEGEGIIFFAFGGFVHGFFSRGQINGPAFLRFSNGEVYEGFFEKGLLHGEAFNYFVDELMWLQCKYERGRFQAVLQEGEGRAPSKILTYLSESKALSNKHRTSENPRVKVLDFQDGQQFIGCADKNRICGLGLLRRQDGKYDIGFNQQGQFIDLARINLPDGGIYDGLLKKGKPHGIGVYFYPNDKSWYVGTFEHGICLEKQKQGKGKYPFSTVQKIRTYHHQQSKRFVQKNISPNIFSVPTGYNRSLKDTVWQPHKIEQLREKTFGGKKSTHLIRNCFEHLDLNNRAFTLQSGKTNEGNTMKLRNINDSNFSKSPKSKLYSHFSSSKPKGKLSDQNIFNTQIPPNSSPRKEQRGRQKETNIFSSPYKNQTDSQFRISQSSATGISTNPNFRILMDKSNCQGFGSGIGLSEQNSTFMNIQDPQLEHQMNQISYQNEDFLKRAPKNREIIQPNQQNYNSTSEKDKQLLFSSEDSLSKALKLAENIRQSNEKSKQFILSGSKLDSLPQYSHQQTDQTDSMNILSNKQIAQPQKLNQNSEPFFQMSGSQKITNTNTFFEHYKEALENENNLKVYENAFLTRNTIISQEQSGIQSIDYHNPSSISSRENLIHFQSSIIGIQDDYIANIKERSASLFSRIPSMLEKLPLQRQIPPNHHQDSNFSGSFLSNLGSYKQMNDPTALISNRTRSQPHFDRNNMIVNIPTMDDYQTSLLSNMKNPNPNVKKQYRSEFPSQSFSQQHSTQGDHFQFNSPSTSAINIITQQSSLGSPQQLQDLLVNTILQKAQAYPSNNLEIPVMNHLNNQYDSQTDHPQGKYEEYCNNAKSTGRFGGNIVQSEFNENNKPLPKNEIINPLILEEEEQQNEFQQHFLPAHDIKCQDNINDELCVKNINEKENQIFDQFINQTQSSFQKFQNNVDHANPSDIQTFQTQNKLPLESNSYFSPNIVLDSKPQQIFPQIQCENATESNQSSNLLFPNNLNILIPNEQQNPNLLSPTKLNSPSIDLDLAMSPKKAEIGRILISSPFEQIDINQKSPRCLATSFNQVRPSHRAHEDLSSSNLNYSQSIELGSNSLLHLQTLNSPQLSLQSQDPSKVSRAQLFLSPQNVFISNNEIHEDVVNEDQESQLIQDEEKQEFNVITCQLQLSEQNRQEKDIAAEHFQQTTSEELKRELEANLIKEFKKEEENKSQSQEILFSEIQQQQQIMNSNENVKDFNSRQFLNQPLENNSSIITQIEPNQTILLEDSNETQNGVQSKGQPPEIEKIILKTKITSQFEPVKNTKQEENKLVSINQAISPSQQIKSIQQEDYFKQSRSPTWQKNDESQQNDSRIKKTIFENSNSLQKITSKEQIVSNESIKQNQNQCEFSTNIKQTKEYGSFKDTDNTQNIAHMFLPSVSPEDKRQQGLEDSSSKSNEIGISKQFYNETVTSQPKFEEVYDVLNLHTSYKMGERQTENNCEEPTKTNEQDQLNLIKGSEQNNSLKSPQPQQQEDKMKISFKSEAAFLENKEQQEILDKILQQQEKLETQDSFQFQQEKQINIDSTDNLLKNVGNKVSHFEQKYEFSQDQGHSQQIQSNNELINLKLSKEGKQESGQLIQDNSQVIDNISQLKLEIPLSFNNTQQVIDSLNNSQKVISTVEEFSQPVLIDKFKELIDFKTELKTSELKQDIQVENLDDCHQYSIKPYRLMKPFSQTNKSSKTSVPIDTSQNINQQIEPNNVDTTFLKKLVEFQLENEQNNIEQGKINIQQVDLPKEQSIIHENQMNFKTNEQILSQPTIIQNNFESNMNQIEEEKQYQIKEFPHPQGDKEENKQEDLNFIVQTKRTNNLIESPQSAKLRFPNETIIEEKYPEIMKESQNEKTQGNSQEHQKIIGNIKGELLREQKVYETQKNIFQNLNNEQDIKNITKNNDQEKVNPNKHNLMTSPKIQPRSLKQKELAPEFIIESLLTSNFIDDKQKVFNQTNITLESQSNDPEIQQKDKKELNSIQSEQFQNEIQLQEPERNEPSLLNHQISHEEQNSSFHFIPNITQNSQDINLIIKEKQISVKFDDTQEERQSFQQPPNQELTQENLELQKEFSNEINKQQLSKEKLNSNSQIQDPFPIRNNINNTEHGNMEILLFSTDPQLKSLNQLSSEKQKIKDNQEDIISEKAIQIEKKGGESFGEQSEFNIDQQVFNQNQFQVRQLDEIVLNSQDNQQKYNLTKKAPINVQKNESNDIHNEGSAQNSNSLNKITSENELKKQLPFIDDQNSQENIDNKVKLLYQNDLEMQQELIIEQSQDHQKSNDLAQNNSLELIKIGKLTNSVIDSEKFIRNEVIYPQDSKNLKVQDLYEDQDIDQQKIVTSESILGQQNLTNSCEIEKLTNQLQTNLVLDKNSDQIQLNDDQIMNKMIQDKKYNNILETPSENQEDFSSQNESEQSLSEKKAHALLKQLNQNINISQIESNCLKKENTKLDILENSPKKSLIQSTHPTKVQRETVSKVQDMLSILEEKKQITKTEELLFGIQKIEKEQQLGIKSNLEQSNEQGSIQNYNENKTKQENNNSQSEFYDYQCQKPFANQEISQSTQQFQPKIIDKKDPDKAKCFNNQQNLQNDELVNQITFSSISPNQEIIQQSNLPETPSQIEQISEDKQNLPQSFLNNYTETGLLEQNHSNQIERTLNLEKNEDFMQIFQTSQPKEQHIESIDNQQTNVMGRQSREQSLLVESNLQRQIIQKGDHIGSNNQKQLNDSKESNKQNKINELNLLKDSENNIEDPSFQVVQFSPFIDISNSMNEVTNSQIISENIEQKRKDSNSLNKKDINQEKIEIIQQNISFKDEKEESKFSSQNKEDLFLTSPGNNSNILISSQKIKVSQDLQLEQYSEIEQRNLLQSPKSNRAIQQPRNQVEVQFNSHPIQNYPNIIETIQNNNKQVPSETDDNLTYLSLKKEQQQQNDCVENKNIPLSQIQGLELSHHPESTYNININTTNLEFPQEDSQIIQQKDKEFAGILNQEDKNVSPDNIIQIGFRDVLNQKERENNEQKNIHQLQDNRIQKQENSIETRHIEVKQKFDEKPGIIKSDQIPNEHQNFLHRFKQSEEEIKGKRNEKIDQQNKQQISSSFTSPVELSQSSQFNNRKNIEIPTLKTDAIEQQNKSDIKPFSQSRRIQQNPPDSQRSNKVEKGYSLIHQKNKFSLSKDSQQSIGHISKERSLNQQTERFNFSSSNFPNQQGKKQQEDSLILTSPFTSREKNIQYHSDSMKPNYPSPSSTKKELNQNENGQRTISILQQYHSQMHQLKELKQQQLSEFQQQQRERNQQQSQMVILEQSINEQNEAMKQKLVLNQQSQQDQNQDHHHCSQTEDIRKNNQIRNDQNNVDQRQQLTIDPLKRDLQPNKQSPNTQIKEEEKKGQVISPRDQFQNKIINKQYPPNKSNQNKQNFIEINEASSKQRNTRQSFEIQQSILNQQTILDLMNPYKNDEGYSSLIPHSRNNSSNKVLETFAASLRPQTSSHKLTPRQTTFSSKILENKSQSKNQNSSDKKASLISPRQLFDKIRPYDLQKEIITPTHTAQFYRSSIEDSDEFDPTTVQFHYTDDSPKKLISQKQYPSPKHNNLPPEISAQQIKKPKCLPKKLNESEMECSASKNSISERLSNVRELEGKIIQLSNNIISAISDQPIIKQNPQIAKNRVDSAHFLTNQRNKDLSQSHTILADNRAILNSGPQSQSITPKSTFVPHSKLPPSISSANVSPIRYFANNHRNIHSVLVTPSSSKKQIEIQDQNSNKCKSSTPQATPKKVHFSSSIEALGKLQFTPQQKQNMIHTPSKKSSQALIISSVQSSSHSFSPLPASRSGLPLILSTPQNNRSSSTLVLSSGSAIKQQYSQQGVVVFHPQLIQQSIIIAPSPGVGSSRKIIISPVRSQQKLLSSSSPGLRNSTYRLSTISPKPIKSHNQNITLSPAAFIESRQEMSKMSSQKSPDRDMKEIERYPDRVPRQKNCIQFCSTSCKQTDTLEDGEVQVANQNLFTLKQLQKDQLDHVSRSSDLKEGEGDCNIF